jgi:NfeD-like C-terminal, partner-binding
MAHSLVGLVHRRICPASFGTLFARRLLFLVLRCWSHWRGCPGVAGDRPGRVGSAHVLLDFFRGTSILFRRRLLARFGPKAGDGNVDSLVGEAATVIDNIEAGGFGKVELRGTAWNARNSSDRILVRGERCKVHRVDGLSLWVNKEES